MQIEQEDFNVREFSFRLFNLRYDLATCLVERNFTSVVGEDFCKALESIAGVLNRVQKDYTNEQ